MSDIIRDLGLKEIDLLVHERVFDGHFAVAMENARGFLFTLIGKDRRPKNMTGHTVTLLQKKDGKLYSSPCQAENIEKGQFKVFFAPDAIQTSGDMEIQFNIEDAEGNTLKSIPFLITVYASLDTSTAGGGNVVIDFNELKQAVQQSQTLVDETKQIKQDTQTISDQTTQTAQEVNQIKTELAPVLEKEQERQENEAARVEAENQRATAEAKRQSEFESAQQDRATKFDNAQTQREEAFNAKQAERDAEDARITQAEAARATAEKARAEAETARAEAEQGRKTAEQGRVEAENARVEAENQRATAESTRAEAESTRANAEVRRQQAEQGRATAEGERVTAEESRVTAETQRTSRFNDVMATLEDNPVGSLAVDMEQVKREKADKTYVDQRFTDLVGTAPEALDTLGEIAERLEDDSDAVMALTEQVTQKADKSYVDTKLDTKANAESVNADLALKADKATVNEALSAKADSATVTTELAKKANKAEVDEIKTHVPTHYSSASIVDNNLVLDRQNGEQTRLALPKGFSGKYADLTGKPDLTVYQQKESGKGLSTNDFTDDKNDTLSELAEILSYSLENPDENENYKKITFTRGDGTRYAVGEFKGEYPYPTYSLTLYGKNGSTVKDTLNFNLTWNENNDRVLKAVKA